MKTQPNALSQGRNGGTPIWSTFSTDVFRNERDAQDILALRHDGWFTDDECNETAIGIVGRLPHGRFIAGYRWTYNGERVYFPEVFDAGEDAACMANEHARVFAEGAREDSKRFSAMIDAEQHEAAVAEDVQMAFEARNVSARHREYARDRIEELRAARADLIAATAAYEHA